MIEFTSDTCRTVANMLYAGSLKLEVGKSAINLNGRCLFRRFAAEALGGVGSRLTFGSEK